MIRDRFRILAAVGLGLLLLGVAGIWIAPRLAPSWAPPVPTPVEPEAGIPRPLPEARIEEAPVESDGPPSEEPKSTAHIEVVVSEADGSPAAGAVVLLSSNEDAPWRAIADSDGRAAFSVPVSNWFGFSGGAVAHLGERAGWSGWFNIDLGGRRGVPVTLRRGLRVRGVVLDDAGRGVQARVRLSISRWSFSPHFQSSLELAPETLVRGRFTFPPLPPPELDPELEDFGAYYLTAEHAGHFDASVQLSAERAREGEVTLRLVRVVVVRGRAVDGDGRVLAGASVRSTWRRADFEPGPVTTTGADGRFELPGQPAPGKHIDIDCAEHRPVRVRVSPAGDNAVVDLGDVVLAASGTISGVVVYDSGRSAPGARIDITFGGFRRTVKATESGRFTISDLGDGPHRISAFELQRPCSGAARRAKLDGIPPGAADVRLILDGGMLIRVDLAYPPGHQPPEVNHPYTHLIVSGKDRRGRPFRHDGHWFYTTRSVRIPAPAPGPLEIRVEMKGYAPVTLIVHPLPDREIRMTATLRKLE